MKMSNTAVAVNGGTGYKLPEVKRAVISTYQTYEVKDYELEVFKDGRDGGVYLNIALFCLSSAITLVVSLVLSPPTDDVTGAYLRASAVFAFILSILFFVLMRRTKAKVDKVYKDVLSRKQEEDEPAKEVPANI